MYSIFLQPFSYEDFYFTVYLHWFVCSNNIPSFKCHILTKLKVLFFWPAYKQQLEAPHEELLSDALHSVETELRKLAEIPWLYYVFQPNDDEVSLINTSCF